MSGPPWQNHFGEEAVTTHRLQTSQSDGADWRAATWHDVHRPRSLLPHA